MSHYDACFLAIACALFSERPRRWWLGALIPLFGFGLALLPIGHFAAIVVGLAACLPPLAPAPAALLLAVPAYPSPIAALTTALLYLAGVAALAALFEDRLDHDSLPRRLRGAPIRLLVLGIAYFGLLPAGHL
jgi:hypothetical protein